MKDQAVLPPPASLLHAGAAAPQAKTLVAELRTDASIDFDPQAAPAFLEFVRAIFGALVIWRVDLSWTDAQKVQLWLTGAPAGGASATREEALKDFFENLPDANGNLFLDYLGTYLTTGVSHASYTMVIGMRKPVPRDDYKQAFVTELNRLSANPGVAAWYAELASFMKLIFNQPSSNEQFLTLASTEGDLAANDAHGNPAFPLIKALIT
jgi:hypothetical protein